MREFYPLLAQCPLFQGIPQGELEQVLPHLGARTLRASRHQHLLAAGEPARWMGIVLSGSVRIVIGDRVERARKDESFYFKPTAPHKLVNAGKSACRVLWVSTPPSF